MELTLYRCAWARLTTIVVILALGIKGTLSLRAVGGRSGHGHDRPGRQLARQAALAPVKRTGSLPRFSGRRSDMSTSTKWAAALLALGLGATAPSGAHAAEPAPASPSQPTTQELMAQIEALKAKVGQMEQSQQK